MSSINFLNMRSVLSSFSAHRRKEKEQDKGATLMEVLLVVGVIVVLAASAYKLYSMVQSNIQSSNEQNNWICPYISRHLLSLNPLLACCRRYSRGER